MRSGPQFAATEAVPSGPRSTKSRTPILAPTQQIAELDDDDDGDDVEAEPLSTQTRGTMRKRKAAPRSSAAPWVLGGGLGILGVAILAFVLMGRGSQGGGAAAPAPAALSPAAAPEGAAVPPPDLSLSQPEAVVQSTPAPVVVPSTPPRATAPTTPKVVETPKPAPAAPTPAPVIEATPRPEPPPSPRLATLSIQHSPVSRATAGTSRGITATIEGAAEARVTIHFGPPGGPHSSVEAAAVSGGVYRGTIPIPATGALEYWIEAEGGGAQARSGSKSKPHRIAVF